MTNDHIIFDRKRMRTHRERAAGSFDGHDFLLREMAERLCERLDDITHKFPLALDLGAHNGLAIEMLAGRGGIEHLVQSDISQGMIKSGGGYRLVADEEFLPFADNTFDLVISTGSLHWVNDLPGTLVQIRRILKPDGLFLGMMPGGQTLKELRQSLEGAELAITGGLSPRISPFVDVKDAGSLLQRAGFALPVVDSELLTVSYGHPMRLLQDLRAMGETNALKGSVKGMAGRELFVEAMKRYQENFTGEDGRYPATFELVTLTAWKPDSSQQQPSARGSGQVSLSSILKH